MSISAIFGVSDSAVNTAINIAGLVAVVLWAALVFWTYSDAKRRIDDSMLVGCATLAALVPFLGTLIYVILRPPEYLDDVRLRELEMQAAEARMAELDLFICPHCDCDVKSDFLCCPSCMRKLRERCPTCAKPVDHAWKLCPYCETEFGFARPSQGRMKRSSTQTTPQQHTEALELPSSAVNSPSSYQSPSR
jgi:hypothetical protein